ncbi:hypothetical protein LX32DRAFT_205251 [Colletotrichum zoysiae]|uniref:Uncharacterized protein n=1 Tax=Colletotrichum zoysiae TaxID=1216348 RepID=A0AAD9H656_9PEZI|nr:hypothetical protein LX32DRAFT_205251 [Colletotrichum zoysiae]
MRLGLTQHLHPCLDTVVNLTGTIGNYLLAKSKRRMQYVRAYCERQPPGGNPPEGRPCNVEWARSMEIPRRARHSLTVRLFSSARFGLPPIIHGHASIPPLSVLCRCLTAGDQQPLGRPSHEASPTCRPTTATISRLTGHLLFIASRVTAHMHACQQGNGVVSCTKLRCPPTGAQSARYPIVHQSAVFPLP